MNQPQIDRSILPPAEASGTPFVDVPSTPPFATYITWMYREGVSTGWVTARG